MRLCKCFRGRIFIGVIDKGKVIGTDTSNVARSRLQDTINKVDPRLQVDIIDAKNLTGGIMENIDDAIVFLKRNLRVSYEIKTAQRKNILELPENALREAVTNAVCHRDNFEKGARVQALEE